MAIWPIKGGLLIDPTDITKISGEITSKFNL